MITKELISAFLTFTIINAAQAMEQGELAASGQATSPTITLVKKTAASIEAQRLNPPPTPPSLWERRANFNPAFGSKFHPAKSNENFLLAFLKDPKKLPKQ